MTDDNDRPRQSGMETKHEQWVLAVINWMGAHNIPMEGDIPAMLHRLGDQMLAAAQREAHLQRTLEAVQKELLKYHQMTVEEPPLSSIESDLISAGEDIGKDYQSETHTRLWPAIKQAVDAIRVARKQRDDMRKERDGARQRSEMDNAGMHEARKQRDLAEAKLDEFKLEPGHKYIAGKHTEVLHGTYTIAIRGVDHPCEQCHKLEGSTLDNGWYRCANCGYPSQ